MGGIMKFIKLFFITIFLLPVSMHAYAAPTGQDLGDKWCSDVKMHFYAGGPEAGGFAGIVAAGAMNAIRDTGACLLYTSPSPRDATLSRMPSSA